MKKFTGLFSTTFLIAASIISLPQSSSAKAEICGGAICINNYGIKSAVAVLDKDDNDMDIYFFSKQLSAESLKEFALDRGKDVAEVAAKIEIEYADKDLSRIKEMEININNEKSWEQQLNYDAGLYVKSKFKTSDISVAFDISSPQGTNVISLTTRGIKPAKTKGGAVDISWDISNKAIPLYVK